MHTLTFTLSPEGVIRVHDAVVCLSKFGESVSIEARHDKFILSALNSSKSAHASFCLDRPTFFENYKLNQAKSSRTREDAEARFTCQIYNKALLSVFRSRIFDTRDKEAAVEKCEVSIQEQPDKTECRLVVKMFCRHGVKKTYRLTYESIEVMHAVFDKNAAPNRWSISANVLKSFIEYFGATTEQLDMYSENGRAQFTSYTEKIMDGKEILKQPLQTCVTIDVLDFEEFHVEERVHIGISVKDFKSIVLHAETLKARVSALYSHPTRPMQLGYSEHGMNCAFTLMTIGDYRGGSVTPAPAVARNTSVTPSARTNPQQASAMQRSFQDHQQGRNNSMPPPMQKAPRNFTREPASQRPPRPSPPPPKASVDEESLFISMDDDDRKWGERNFDEDDFEDTLGWDPNANNGTASAGLSNLKYRKTVSSLRFHDDKPVAPTQRLSQIATLFGD